MMRQRWNSPDSSCPKESSVERPTERGPPPPCPVVHPRPCADTRPPRTRVGPLLGRAGGRGAQARHSHVFTCESGERHPVNPNPSRASMGNPDPQLAGDTARIRWAAYRPVVMEIGGGSASVGALLASRLRRNVSGSGTSRVSRRSREEEGKDDADVSRGFQGIHGPRVCWGSGSSTVWATRSPTGLSSRAPRWSNSWSDPVAGG